MHIDHIFIFTEDQGQIADELVAAGFTEGSHRIHVGQGTANRKFYCENVFLEVLWVHDESELLSEPTRRMGLWKRAQFRKHQSSPFGLCLVNTETTQSLFEGAFAYQPEYFPAGMAIDILPNEAYPYLPWIFRLPFKGRKSHEEEPTDHANGIRTLSKAVFEYQGSPPPEFLEPFKPFEEIQFVSSHRNWLRLLFDSGRQGKEQEIPKLFLTIEY